MKYMSWTLNEVLRLYPSVPMNTRTAAVDTTLPKGGGPDGLGPLGIPKGTEVAYSAYNLQLNAEHYLPPDSAEYIDPTVFEPERWRTWTPKPFTYLPFNVSIPLYCTSSQHIQLHSSTISSHNIHLPRPSPSIALISLPNPGRSPHLRRSAIRPDGNVRRSRADPATFRDHSSGSADGRDCGEGRTRARGRRRKEAVL